MLRNRWLLVLTSVVAVGSVARVVLNPVISRGAERRITSEELVQVEEDLGVKLYAPTWLPLNGRVGATGMIRGAHRVLQDFSDENERSILIMAQEPRTPERDRYNAKVFVKGARARGSVNGKPAFFINGSSGERRLFWNEPKTAVIISSLVLDDQDLLEVAAKLR